MTEKWCDNHNNTSIVFDQKKRPVITIMIHILRLNYISPLPCFGGILYTKLSCEKKKYARHYVCVPFFFFNAYLKRTDPNKQAIRLYSSLFLHAAYGIGALSLNALKTNRRREFRLFDANGFGMSVLVVSTHNLTTDYEISVSRLLCKQLIWDIFFFFNVKLFFSTFEKIILFLNRSVI